MLPLFSEPHGQHNRVLSAGQPSAPPKPSATVRYGEAVCSEGYTAIPNTVFHHYARLGISDGELVFIQQVWTYWWDAALPYPSVATLAARMGKSVRQIQHYIEHLRRLDTVRVVERRDAHGGQLSNAYDLRPLLQAVARLVEQDGELGVQHPAPARMHETAPKTNPVQENQSSISISMPPPPELQQVPSVETTSSSVHMSGELQATVERIGRTLGDSAPISSLTRAVRMQAHYRLEETPFIDLLESVSRRVLAAMPRITGKDPTGQPNAMPYFFASVAAQVTAPSRPASSVRPASGRHHRARPSGRTEAADFHREALPTTGLPVWDRVRNDLRDTLAPGAFAQYVEPLRARFDPAGGLVVETDSPLHQHWVESRLRGRIDEILRTGGHHDIAVSIAGPVAYQGTAG